MPIMLYFLLTKKIAENDSVLKVRTNRTESQIDSDRFANSFWQGKEPSYTDPAERVLRCSGLGRSAKFAHH